MERNAPTWSYDWLPVEILEMVITYLPDFSSFRNSRLVNCLWYTVTHDMSEKYWKLKYQYYFGGPKEEGQSDEEAFSKNQKEVIKEYKKLTGSGFSARIMVEQSLIGWAKKLGHQGFVTNVALYEKKLNELLSLPDYSQRKHSQWFTSTRDAEEGHPEGPVRESATREKQKAVWQLSRQELVERKKKIAMYNHLINNNK